jgi:hypothetical protein
VDSAHSILLLERSNMRQLPGNPSDGIRYMDALRERSGSRESPDRLVTTDFVTAHHQEASSMVTYGSARNSLVAELLKDAAAHEAGHFAKVGERFARVERDLPQGTSPALTKLRVALAFWDGWIEARDQGWLGGGNIPKGEWPMLARRIASDLSADRDITDARVGARFTAPAQT